MKYQNILEEELKNKVGQDFFEDFDTTKIVGKIDFCVTLKDKTPEQEKLIETDSLLWAEAKRGSYDILTMITQLVLTIGKARTFDKFLPPAFLGAFDGEKIAFIPYNTVVDIFSMNDFNWNVPPSKHDTKEFQLIKARIEKSLEQNHYLYYFLNDEKELRFFIKNNLAKATETGKITIDKNNFVPIYLRWLEQVKPYINFNWEEGKKQNILDNSFYLADLFVDDNNTTTIEDDTPISENLFVVLKNGHYEIAKEDLKQLWDASISFKDKKPYEQFWKKYKRPPLEEFQQHILNRKDLLVPQDIRERKGAFFTPRIWVELSQKYIADVLGEDWQEEYTLWDCAAGTGNLLTGLTNKYQIFASTLDQSDVNVMHERIDNGAVLLHDHVFQFDFLNDEFLPISQGGKLPDALYNIITHEEKRKKLVVYINPPYAEGGSSKQKTGTGDYKIGVAKNKIHDKYHSLLSGANRELFAQFLTRIHFEIPNCKIANFSTLKNLQSSHFLDFRKFFRAKLEKIFVVPADTFDNVTGKFPIGFFVWDTNKKEEFKQINTSVYDKNETLIGYKNLYSYEDSIYFSKWVNSFKLKNGFAIGWLEGTTRNSFQHNSIIFIINSKEQMSVPRGMTIYDKNLVENSVCFAVRKSIEATWLNDRDQFLFPNDGWKKDREFQNDCLAYTLFSNNIQSKYGTNHWIPFTEQEVNARTRFESHFMTDFIAGKIPPDAPENLFTVNEPRVHYESPLKFSNEAHAVFNAGRELWCYYHAQPNANVNASLYDIRDYFQGRNDKGKMNTKSDDKTYMKLITQLREALKLLAKKIEPKVYDYGFLKV